MKNQDQRISVLLTTEGTYPFNQGGVSNWADQLVNQLPSVDFVVFSVIMDPFVTQKFNLSDVARLIKVPLWGTEEPTEHLDIPFSHTFLAKLRTSDKIVKEHFIPLFWRMVAEIVAVEKNPRGFATTLADLHRFFREYDYKICMKSQLTWNEYKRIILEKVQTSRGEWDEPDIYCLIQSLGWVYRFFNIINTAIPKTSLTHSSAAAFCGLPCVIAKELYKTPFLLTEHGVYLREQYLSLSKRGYPSFLNTFLVRLVRSVVEVNYGLADQISPVCAYNTRWEKHLTDHPERIEPIYNGVEANLFLEVKEAAHPRPTVVTVARIDPVKDIMTLLRAAALVKQQFSAVRFLLFGSMPVPEYYEQCLALREELGLGANVEFAGHVNTVVQAYQQADIIVQSSISEGFPYAVIEAMMSGKPVVATDVGGVSEALGDTGVLVPPQSPPDLAKAIIQLLDAPAWRQELGTQARERALSLFTLRRSLSNYLKTYIQLAVRAVKTTRRRLPASLRPMVAPTKGMKQRLYANRGYALLDNRRQDLAVGQFLQAIRAFPDSSAVPILLLEVAQIHARQGNAQMAKNELHKFALLTKMRGG